MAGVQDIGNGLGFLYITNQDGLKIVSSQPNTLAGAAYLRSSGCQQSPISSNKSAFAILNLTAIPAVGTITAVLVNGVNLLPSAVTVTGLTVNQATPLIAAAINSYTPGSGYKFAASSNGQRVYLFAPTSAGSVPNGWGILVSASGGTVTYTVTNFAGGSFDEGVTDAILGNRFFLNANYGPSGISGETIASPNSLAYAVEITKYIVVRGSNAGNPDETIVIRNNRIDGIGRYANKTVINMRPSGGGSTDTVVYIDPTDFLDGDELILTSELPGYTVTIEDESAVTVPVVGNIMTAQQLPWNNAGNYGSLVLRYKNIPGVGPMFIEVSRDAQPTTAGIMYTSVYDIDNDGVVDNSQRFGGELPSYYLDLTNPAFTGLLPQAMVASLLADLAARELIANKGAANGYAPLNALQKIDPIYLTLPVMLNPVGEWDANTNTPALADGGGVVGDAYITTIAGSQNLGSGIQNFAIGDLVVYFASLTWIKITPPASPVISVNGLTGVVVLDLDDIADTLTRAAVTPDEAAGIAASPTPITAANPAASQADITAIITVGNGFFMPELFSNGETLGDGTLRTLTSLGYTNVTAALAWPQVAADPRFTIDVNTMDIDWISYQEACCRMQNLMFSAMISPGGRGYCPYNTIYLPREQDVWSGNRRSLGFDFDFKMSRFNNLTGSSFPMFERYPVDQTEANSNFLSFRYFVRNAYFQGNDSTDEDDCFIKIGATVGSRFDNIEAQNCGMVIDAQFCMQSRFTNINAVAYGKYALAIRDGLWVGGGANIAQCNNAWVEDFRSVHGSGKTALAAIYVQGNRNTAIKQATFEGFNGGETQVLYSQAYPPSGTLPGTVKNVLYMESLDFEGAGASRAAIRVVGNNIYSELNRYNTQLSPVDTAVLFELCAANGVNGGMTAYIHGANNYNPGYKFRNINTGGPTQKWYCEKVELNNNASFINAANWDLSFGGSIPTNYSFTPILP